GAQKAPTNEQVTTRAYPVEHASAGLEAKVTDTDRRPVVGDRADRGDQRAGIGIDLDERAGGAKPSYGRAKEAAVGMEGNPTQAHAGNRRADDCAGASYLIDDDQCAGIRSAIAIAAVHGLGTCPRQLALSRTESGIRLGRAAPGSPATAGLRQRERDRADGDK